MRNFKINIIFFTFFTLIFCFKATANIDVPKSDIIQFSGRLHMDLLYNNNRDKTDKKNTLKTLRDDLSGFYISSTMFNAKFNISKNALIVLKFDSKPNSILFKELYLIYILNEKSHIIFGQTGVQPSLENIGYNYTIFNNYSLFSSCDLFTSYSNGIALKYDDTRYGAYIGIYGNSIHDVPKNVSKITLMLRGYFNPIRSNNNLVHIGFNVYNEDRNNKYNNINDIYPFNKIQRVGLEAAINYYFLNVQSEYRTAWIIPEKYKITFNNLYNFYIESTINITGESMIYKEGMFNFIKVKKPLNKSGFGAFSISFKFSETNMNLKKYNYKINCGKFDEYMIAMNWSPVDGFRFTLQYSKIKENFVTNRNSYDLIQLKTRIFF